MGCFESRERVLEEVGPLDDPHTEAPIPRHPRTEVLSVRALLQVLCLHESPTLRERPLTRWAHIGPSAHWGIIREGLWGIILCKLWENLFRKICRVADRRSRVAISNGLPSSQYGQIRHRLNSEHSWWRFTLHCVVEQYGSYLSAIRGQGFELRRLPLTTALRLTSRSLARA